MTKKKKNGDSRYIEYYHILGLKVTWANIETDQTGRVFL